MNKCPQWEGFSAGKEQGAYVLPLPLLTFSPPGVGWGGIVDEGGNAGFWEGCQ